MDQTNRTWLTVLITVIITGAVVAGIMNWQSGERERQYSAERESLKNDIASLQGQINELKAVPGRDEEDVPAVPTSTVTPSPDSDNSELLEAKFRLAIRNFWNVDQVFRNPENKNQFYYIAQDSAGDRIMVYDFSKDAMYAKNKSFDIVDASTELYAKKLAANQEFWGVGFTDGKFVFLETSKDNSPGPCASLWLLSGPAVKYQYIAVGVKDPAPKAFTISSSLKKAEEQKMAECQKGLGN